MKNMDIALIKDNVTNSLWSSFVKTKEYRNGQTEAIPPHHQIVESQERFGLKGIYQKFVRKLSGEINIRTEFVDRKHLDWLNEWKGMHKMLFEHILKNCGDWRKIDVRFGDPGDEVLYKIPEFWKVPQEIGELADRIMNSINQKIADDEEKFQTLATIHYQFIRVHPFEDGNGRIARAITDQLALFLGFPVAMGGYPRHDLKRRTAYHKAIKSCIYDPNCIELALWIKSYINKQMEMIA